MRVQSADWNHFDHLVNFLVFELELYQTASNESNKVQVYS